VRKGVEENEVFICCDVGREALASHSLPLGVTGRRRWCADEALSLKLGRGVLRAQWKRETMDEPNHYTEAVRDERETARCKQRNDYVLENTSGESGRGDPSYDTLRGDTLISTF
jgi:hypothetical protein